MLASRRTLAPAAALLALVAACGGGGTADPAAGPPAAVSVASGDGQRGAVGAPLPLPLAVRVSDAAGRPVPGQAVRFVVVRGGGTVAAGTSPSDAAGVAQDRWTLGTTVTDTQRVEARVVEQATGRTIATATFTALATPAAPATVAVAAGAAQFAPAGTPVAVAPAVRVVDAYGNAVAGAAVVFTATAGGGTVDGASAVTDSLGVARVGGWTLGPVAEAPNALTATTGTASASVTATATTPVRVAVVAPASGAVVTGGFAVRVTASTLARGGAIASVTAVVDGQSTALAHDATTDAWTGAVPLPTSTASTKTLDVTAVDRAGNRAAARVTVGYVGDPEPIDPRAPNYVRLVSDPGDYVGAGLSYRYTQADAVISVVGAGRYLEVTVDGDQYWVGRFELPNTLTELRDGTYTGLGRVPVQVASVGGMSWSGEARTCGGLTASLTLANVTYAGNLITGFDLLFEQRCVFATSALRGVVHWRKDDPTRPPGPVQPPPATLWRPPAGAVPATGDYVYLQGEPGERLIGGQTLTFLETTTPITLGTSGSPVVVAVDRFVGEFTPMETLARLEAGYYPDVLIISRQNPTRGGIDWGFTNGGCSRATGWFVVDRVVYAGSTPTALELRFEQRCDGATAALRGAMRVTR